LRRPVVVATDWSPKTVASRDNWRRELADAAVFAPRQDWLIEPEETPARVCASATAWLVGNTHIVSEFRWLIPGEIVATFGELSLWRIAPDSPLRQGLCRGKPSAS